MLIRHMLGCARGSETVSFAAFLLFWIPIACAIMVGLLHHYVVGRQSRVVSRKAMVLLDKHKARILLKSVQAGQHLISAAALARGAAPDGKDRKGDTLLHMAAWKNMPAVARVLLKFGANINQSNRAKLKALHIAASQLHPEMTYLLLYSGAKVNAEDMHGRAPIHRICSNSRASDSYRGLQCLNMLLKNGADPCQTDGYGFSAFDLAQKWNAHQYLQILKKYSNGGKDCQAGA